MFSIARASKLSRPQSFCRSQVRSFHASSSALSQTSAYRIPLLIDGRDVTTEQSFAVQNPRTGKAVWESSTCTEKHAAQAVKAAEDAFPQWSQTKPSERRDIFIRAADIIERRRKELGSYMHHEIGANQYYQDFILGLSIEGLKDTAGRISEVTQGFVPHLSEKGAHGIVYREPYGVVLGIGPWYVYARIARPLAIQTYILEPGTLPTIWASAQSRSQLLRETLQSSKDRSSHHVAIGGSQTYSGKLASPMECSISSFIRQKTHQE